MRLCLGVGLDVGVALVLAWVGGAVMVGVKVSTTAVTIRSSPQTWPFARVRARARARVRVRANLALSDHTAVVHSHAAV